MFTAKHHAGFCMWDTATTDFQRDAHPYGKDVTRARPGNLRITPGSYSPA
jgi:hypothetical protein